MEKVPSSNRGRQVTGKDVANAKDYFEHFLNATSLKNILGYYRSICDLLNLKPNLFPLFYPKLRGHLTSWRAKALWKKFDARATHKCYGKGKLCSDRKVLIIGAGPCGLRTAIEAQLLGAKVVVIEKRDRLSRNNVLHLWPFVIEDLRALGAKKFFGKFCAGSIDHISIRQLQCILLKVALLLGVEVHTEVSFERLIEPDPIEKRGWRAEFEPINHPVSQYEFDVIIGADGKRNTLQGFKRKEFRGKLAIAITANFINKRTEAEARVEEISGVAFIFNQKFFKDLYEVTGIDLENIVYYKDDTHYFVMTAKKPSLIEKGVIKQDLADTERLLAPDNVNREALMDYAREAANFSTNYQMPDLEFAVNHYGQPDVAMFDFTSMYAAENASKFVERHGFRLLMILVGDSLLEPFWPTGSGCARGFLSSLDAAWAIRSWSIGNMSPLDVLAERESIYRLLAQTTPDNLNKDWKAYTVDPTTRYPNLNKNVVMPHQTLSLFDTDNPVTIERMRRNSHDVQVDIPKKRRRENVDNDVLLNWISEQIQQYEDIIITDIASVFRNGKALCAILDRYRPDLLDYNTIKDDDPVKNNQLAIDILEKEIGISPVMTGEEITNTEDYLTMAAYLTQVYDSFRGEIPHIVHPRLELPEAVRSETIFKSIKPVTHYNASSIIPPTRPSSKHKRHADSIISNKSNSMEKKMRKRRTLDKVNVNVEERKKTWEEIEANRVERQNKRRQQRKLQTERFLKSMQMLQANAKPDSPQPFEDYSIFLYRQTAQNFEDRVKDLEKKFTYIPDHENKQLPSQTTRGNVDEDFAAKIKSIEEKWKEPVSVDKKPKDLLRAIGKIETSDWNIKEIEKKILENKLGKPSSTNKDKEKVPKWSKEEFLARQTKMEKKHLDRQDSSEAKFADIDRNIKHLELKLKEGTVRDLGQNKVASITEKLGGNKPTSEEPKPIQKSQSRPVMLPAQGGSEFCHFCGKRVYLMERLSAEGRFFHHGCFKCQYCHTQLRLGSYAFDKDGLYDHKFFCIHHFGMKGELKTGKVNRKPSLRLNKSPEKKNLGGIAGLDLLDRVRTPERVEFSNLSAGIASSDHDESLSQMDEDEWTDKNFGASAAELGSSDDDSFSASDSDDEDGDDDAYEEALEEPATKEGTMKWAERFTKRYSKNRNDSDSDDYSSSDQSSYYENTSDDDDSETATEGEEEIRARELRKQEVQVEPPVVQNDTGTDTEIVSDESTSESSSEVRNSATEISTDSEFAHDDPTPTREIPSIVFNDFHVTKTRGSGNHPKRIQVTSGYLQKPINKDKKAPVTTTTTTTTITATATTTGITSTSTTNRDNIELNLTPLVPSAPSIIRKTAPTLFPRTEGFALNRTQSTGGIAAKVSLELKKKYLLGENSGSGSIQKSGSASTLDTKLKSFHTNITDCQKMLKPASEIYANTTQTYYNKLNDKFLPNQTPKIVEEKKSEEKEETPEKAPVVFENELEGRPRSPLLETSIIVPKFDWSKNNTSHTEDSLSDDSTEEEQVKAPIPILQIEEFPPDSLCVEEMTKIEKPLEEPKIVMNDPPKSIATEKKTLNQPKQLPILENKNILPEIHNSLHVMKKQEPEVKSGRSTPSDNDSVAEQATAALTETELSDWARDGEVSDDLEDVEFDWNMDTTNSRYNKQPKIVKVDQPKVDKIEHVCGKDESKDKIIITEAINNMLSKNLENIEFMDTGTETSSDDGVPDSQNGYILLKNEEELVEDSLNPNINTIIEAKNENVDVVMPKNTGYCILAIENNKFGSEVIDLNPEDLEKLKSKNNGEHDEDSLLILDTGTTTEDNTCSDSTVKNITEISADHEKTIKPPLVIDNNNFQRKRLEEKLAKLKAEAKQQNQSTPSSTAEIISSQTNENNVTFDEHCQRLQSKIEFGNAKDSIDIRKSKRKSKDSPQKPDLIQEESSVTPVTKDIMLDLTPTVRTPDVLYKKEYIERERDVNQRLVQEMVMSKLKAENKSLERRKRRGQITPNRLNELTKSATTDIVSEINKSNLESSKNSTPSSIYVTPDLIPTLKKSPTVASVHSSPLNSVRPISVCSTSIVEQNKENSNIIESKRALFQDDFKTPVAPPRLKHEEAKRTAEKLKQDARVRARLMSNEELGLSPEDKLKMLKEKFLKRDDINIETVTKPERSNSWLYSNDTLNRKKRYKTNDNDSNPIRTKSIPEISVEPNIVVSLEEKFCKSDPNILETVERKQPGVKKDRERRKSITKMFTTLFKKSPSGNSKSIFSKMSPKKDISKEIVLEEPVRRKSFSETNRIARNRYVDTPPPVPPLPLNYTGNSIKGTDESSDGENDWKKTDRSSCDTLDQSGILDNSISSSSTRKSSKSARRTARQSQLKRHRLAQEIQRKLEETEVKTRELEERGVTVEKALRGEESGRFFKEESELLQEWFDLMRDRTELRRYEKELMVRAQELELEDRHARLQHELRERLENNDTKTEEDVAAEGAIIKEMMQIVAQRDSLIALLQEERLRYSNEDRDFEEQMLVKGLRLTPIQKTPEK